MRISFEFRLIPCVVAVLLIALGLQLARWQTHRAEEKQQLADQMQLNGKLPPLTWADGAQEPPPFRHLKLRGAFIASWPLYLENRPLQGVAGRYLVMPFRPEHSQQVILVARGWLARDPADRLKLPDIMTPSGNVEIEASVRPYFDRVMQLGDAESVRPGSLLQNLNPEAFARQSGMKTAGFVLEQISGQADGLQRQWPLPSAGIERHRMYAMNWYALSLMALLYLIFSGIRREKPAATNG